MVLPRIEFVISLSDKTIGYGDELINFDIPEGRRQSFLNGTWDAMAILEQNQKEIERVVAGLEYI